MHLSESYSLFSKFACRVSLCTALFFSLCLPAGAITPTHPHHNERARLTAPPIDDHYHPSKKIIYLLDWQGNRMVTTAGIFILSRDIEIIDPQNIQAECSAHYSNIQAARKLHRVIIKTTDRKVVRITIE